MNIKVLLINFILFLFLSLFNSCDISVESRELRTKNGFKWFLLEYSDGTYGVEIGNEIILNNCENKIYIEGYNGDYVFKTQKGKDKQFYNLSGELLFTIPNVEFAHIMSGGFNANNELQNSYILVQDYEGNEGVYSLDGKMIIAPQDCYYISDIRARLDDGRSVVWGFDVPLKSSKQVIYNYDGEFIVSGESVHLEGGGVCPIFCVEKYGCVSLYNYKGERIVKNIHDYMDVYIGYYDGCPYVICETEYATEHYYEKDIMLWISMNGEVLKKEGSTSVDYNIRSKERSEYKRVRDNIRNRMNQLPRFNTPSSVSGNGTRSDNHNYDNNSNMDYYNPSYNNQNDIGYQNSDVYSSEDNSYWESYYRDNYNRYAKLVENHFSILRTLVATGNGGPTSSYSISNVKSYIRDAQREMTRIRNEAQQKGVHIDVSPLENASY